MTHSIDEVHARLFSLLYFDIDPRNSYTDSRTTLIQKGLKKIHYYRKLLSSTRYDELDFGDYDYELLKERLDSLSRTLKRFLPLAYIDADIHETFFSDYDFTAPFSEVKFVDFLNNYFLYYLNERLDIEREDMQEHRNLLSFPYSVTNNPPPYYSRNQFSIFIDNPLDSEYIGVSLPYKSTELLVNDSKIRARNYAHRVSSIYHDTLYDFFSPDNESLITHPSRFKLTELTMYDLKTNPHTSLFYINQLVTKAMFRKVVEEALIVRLNILKLEEELANLEESKEAEEDKESDTSEQAIVNEPEEIDLSGSYRFLGPFSNFMERNRNFIQQSRAEGQFIDERIASNDTPSHGYSDGLHFETHPSRTYSSFLDRETFPSALETANNPSLAPLTISQSEMIERLKGTTYQNISFLIKNNILDLEGPDFISINTEGLLTLYKNKSFIFIGPNLQTPDCFYLDGNIFTYNDLIQSIFDATR